MLVKQVMDRNAAVCVPFDSARSAAIIMKRNGIGFIPVVQNEPTHAYVGAVTDRLLCLRVVGDGLDPERTLLAEYVSSQNAFCRPDDPIEKALQTMQRKRINALAVLDRERNVVAVVLRDEILKRIASGQPAIAARAGRNVKPRTPVSSAVDFPTRRVSAVQAAPNRSGARNRKRPMLRASTDQWASFSSRSH